MLQKNNINTKISPECLVSDSNSLMYSQKMLLSSESIHGQKNNSFDYSLTDPLCSGPCSSYEDFISQKSHNDTSEDQVFYSDIFKGSQNNYESSNLQNMSSKIIIELKENQEEKISKSNINIDLDMEFNNEETQSIIQSDRSSIVNINQNIIKFRKRGKKKRGKKKKKYDEDKCIKCTDVEQYKTEMCKQQMHKGQCSQGKICNQAHGQEELRKKNCEKYKTKLCVKFHKLGLCKQGSRCNFIHEIKEPKCKLQNLLVTWEINQADYNIRG